jgi:hypothetical protein
MKYISDLGNKVHNSEKIQDIKKQLSENKIYVVGAVLIILMFLFLYALLSQILNDKNHTNKFQTSNGAYQELNLDDLQKDIAEFKTLEASSSLKTTTYKEISDKLNFLEAQ